MLITGHKYVADNLFEMFYSDSLNDVEIKILGNNIVDCLQQLIKELEEAKT